MSSEQTSPDSQEGATIPAPEQAATSLESVQLLLGDSAGNQQQLAKIARDDNDEKLRCAAIAGINDLNCLNELLKVPGLVGDAARSQLQKLSEEKTPDESAGGESSDAVKGPEPELVTEPELKSGDGVTSSASEQRPESESGSATEPESATAAQSASGQEPAPAPTPEAESSPEPGLKSGTESTSDSEAAATPAFDEAVTRELTEALEQHLQLLASLQDAIGAEQEQQLLELARSLPESVQLVSRNKSFGLSGDYLTLARLIRAVSGLAARQQMLDECVNNVTRLSHKNTTELVNQQKLVRRLKSEIGWPQEVPATDSYRRLLEAEQKLDEVGSKNAEFQSELLTLTNKLAEELRQALESGNSAEAGTIWDKIQGNISNLSGKTQHDLKEQIAELRSQINELRDWKKFAAAEKKKELINEMQQLLDAQPPPAERAGKIRKLHDSWKKLGYSSQNEELWQQFKKISDEAYAPCREHFKQQKGLMSDNLKHRTEICERLEGFLAELDKNAPRIADLKNFEKQVQEEWKKYAPVEQSKIKKLQKRFYGLLDQVRDIRRTASQANAELKQSLVQQAKALIDLDDRREAMEKAKALQAQWKTIGPAFFKDDRKYWEEFRAACDAIFREQDEKRKAARSEIDKALKASQEVLDKLEALFKVGEEDFRESRKLFASLQRDFNQALSTKIRSERRQLQERFTSLTRKIEARFRKLPDKKQLQARSALEARAAFCRELEEKLLACKDEASLQQARESIDRSSWDSLPASGMEQYDKAMKQRFEALAGVTSLGGLQKLVTTAERQTRELLIEAEIRANLDSPEQDRGLRMELQLNQLKNSFGKGSIEEAGDRERFGHDFLLAFLCSGPLSEAVRTDFQQRADRIAARLL